jgi:hypothetical protein
VAQQQRVIDVVRSCAAIEPRESERADTKSAAA